MKEQPSYYAVLTAEVRYSKVLKPNEKLLYAEITALSNMYGHCFATNKYFASLYDVSLETVSRWVSNLERQGFVNRTIKFKEGSRQIDKRFISLATPIDEIINTSADDKVKTPIDDKVKGNTTILNNSSIENFYPNEVSLLAVSDSYGGVSNQILKSVIQEFKDAATNRDKPIKDLNAGFRNYVRKGWLSSFSKPKQTHAQMRGKVLEMANKPSLAEVARKQIKEQLHGR